jgi:hypothetical protein
MTPNLVRVPETRRPAVTVGLAAAVVSAAIGLGSLAGGRAALTVLLIILSGLCFAGILYTGIRNGIYLAVAGGTPIACALLNIAFTDTAVSTAPPSPLSEPSNRASSATPNTPTASSPPRVKVSHPAPLLTPGAQLVTLGIGDSQEAFESRLLITVTDRIDTLVWLTVTTLDFECSETIGQGQSLVGRGAIANTWYRITVQNVRSDEVTLRAHLMKQEAAPPGTKCP